eukprot:scaffold1182_cov396-Prasinococcus_capsulatus_cf.AAC.24
MRARRTAQDGGRKNLLQPTYRTSVGIVRGGLAREAVHQQVSRNAAARGGTGVRRALCDGGPQYGPDTPVGTWMQAGARAGHTCTPNRSWQVARSIHRDRSGTRPC